VHQNSRAPQYYNLDTITISAKLFDDGSPYILTS
jgi:hypothetical protein